MNETSRSTTVVNGSGGDFNLAVTVVNGSSNKILSATVYHGSGKVALRIDRGWWMSRELIMIVYLII